jgi:hypothetical protein
MFPERRQFASTADKCNSIYFAWVGVVFSYRRKVDTALSFLQSARACFGGHAPSCRVDANRSSDESIAAIRSYLALDIGKPFHCRSHG